MPRLEYSIPKERFLIGISFIYLFAFASLYIQLPGLYGDNGVLPVRAVSLSAPSTVWEFFQYPNLIRLGPLIGIDAYHLLELLVVVGFVLSCLSGFVADFRISPVFLIIWLAYYSIFKVGQTFLWFQWDILILEAGFLAVILSRLLPVVVPRFTASDQLGMFLIRWLLFRLMFASGVVKLTSGCPSWWGLEALHWHYQSECIPNPVAWFAHWLPGWLHKLSVASTLLIEIIFPLLFIFSHRTIRIFSFYAQILLQLLIIATGNFNFFNMLTIVLCYSLLRNEDFSTERSGRSRNRDFTSVLATCLIVTVISASAFFFLDVSFALDGTPNFALRLSMKPFIKFVSFSVLASLYVALGLFIIEFLQSVFTALQARNTWRKCYEFLEVLVIGLVAMTLLFNSAVPYTTLDQTSSSKLPAEVLRLHKELRNYQLTSSYGLFRRITGVGGRPELVLEASSSEDGPWTEYEFQFKPGRLNRTPPIIVPHQPRLDWQMWFAALGRPENHPWLYNLIYRLLQQQKDVLDLLDTSKLPERPKFVRALLYTYQYTSSRTDVNWWKRTFKSTYLTPLSLKSPALIKMIDETGLTRHLTSQAHYMHPVVPLLARLRELIGQPADLSALMLVLCIVCLSKYAISQASRTAVDAGLRREK
ncbi:Lipase maturation factor [Fasciola hepatica]|uniref:Lipase maturation factor n=1 Tax=Fasciola hepatica TaxID=6192 RepID=A0A4E0QXQ3_FASHE|nr:Lipase maturation factor [Fasciola hepatica]